MLNSTNMPSRAEAGAFIRDITATELDALTFNVEDQGYRTIRVATDGSGELTINLGAPEKLAGEVITVYLSSKTTDDVVITAGGPDWEGDLTLDASLDRGVFYSDGVNWNRIHAVAN